MLIQTGFDIILTVAAPTQVLSLLQIHPSRAGDIQPGSEHFSVDPALDVQHYQDGFGNRCSRISMPEGLTEIRLHGAALVHDSGLPDPQHPEARQLPLHELPNEVLQFLLPSRYCDFEGDLMQFAWEQFGHTPTGWARVQAICDYVHQHLKFDYQAACATRTATQGWQQGTGVCRDFAHMAVALCRCMNIPARYATGYLGDIGVPAAPYPMDFSAWFEVFLEGGWHTFDARHNIPRIGRIVLGYGRDAADVPITMGFGPSELKRFDVVTDEVTAPEAVSA